MGLYLSILTSVCILLIGVLAIFVITGMAGMFSLGQASFMAIGAYVSGILVTRFAVPFFVALVLAVLAGMLFGLLVGLPTIRLRRDYIALVTFGFGEAIIAVLNNATSLTSGAMGLSGIPKYTTPALAIGSVVVGIYLVRNFKYSKFGRQCISVKSDELAAGAMGINANKIKLTAFLLASAFTAYAGALYGFFTTYLDPGLFGWMRSAEWIIIVFFGGLSSLTGSIVSGLLLGTLPEILRFAAEWRVVIYCAIVLLIINYRPQGLFGEYELNFKKWTARIAAKKKNRPQNTQGRG